MKSLLLALLGFLILVAVVSVVSVLIMTMMWWMFRNDIDFEDLVDTKGWEGEYATALVERMKKEE